MKEDIKKILSMFRDEKLTIDEATDLLETLIEPNFNSGNNYTKKYLRLIIKSPGKDEVSLKLPISMIKLMKRIIPKNLKNNGFDSEEAANITKDIFESIDKMDDEKTTINTEDGTEIIFNLE
ncbi:hypothetical protein OF820_13035 [Oceanotoga sp. DSM 15011]|jgi:hypothetical protein|uniref:Uncharacterized protein n=1 Tax=Oceanotoga teriensis TaxID=515440 RepID=A0AA45C8G0_9BACT|nr:MULTISPECIES: hypothetical protein [Oceanotoga]MDN5342381.1 hypothetical protein [Oceanotoga sp.]MDO7975538.1 hypothetical protein [Oceanotoga teriensis]PWJ96174.1 hypothetical protein C7380_10285 [Oceanotoga teriensis]UYO99957.1 hypothetical protein OF820_13035 [Oceanotoga sp. DSM 15011]